MLGLKHFCGWNLKMEKLLSPYKHIYLTNIHIHIALPADMKYHSPIISIPRSHIFIIPPVVICQGDQGPLGYVDKKQEPRLG